MVISAGPAVEGTFSHTLTGNDDIGSISFTLSEVSSGSGYLFQATYDGIYAAAPRDVRGLCFDSSSDFQQGTIASSAGIWQFTCSSLPPGTYTFVYARD